MIGRLLRRWLALLSTPCDEASRTLSDEWDGPVETSRQWGAHLHCLTCGPCGHEKRRMRWLRRLLESAPDRVREREFESTPLLTAEAALRMKRALREAVGEGWS